MSTSAMWLATRMVARRGLAATVVLAILISIVAGLATAMLSTAQDIDRAFARLAEDVDAPNFFVEASCEACEPIVSPERALRSDSAVAAVDVLVTQSLDLRTATGTRLGPEPDTPCSTGAGELGIASSAWTRHGAPPARIVDGRFPTPGSVSEVVLPVSTARRAGVHVGDTLTLAAACRGGEQGPPIDAQLTVVGIAVGPTDVHPPGTQVYFEMAFADPALTSRFELTFSTLLAVWLRDGLGPDALSMDPPPAIVFNVDDHAREVEHSLRPDATTLRVLALATAIVGLLVIGHLVVRRIRQAVMSAAPLSSIGASRADVARVGATIGAAIGVVGAILTVAVSIAARPLLPRGAAADVLRGGRSGVGLASALIGAAATALVVTLVSGVGAWSAARRVRSVSDTRRPSLPARLAEWLSLRPPAALGLRVAFEPTGSAGGTPVRSGLASIAIALGAVAGALTFGSSLQQLRHDTRLVGWAWDVAAYTRDPGDIASTLASNPAVERISVGTIFASEPLTFDMASTQATSMYTFDTGPHAVKPIALTGRAPAGPAEILLAPGAARKLGVGIGDAVSLFRTDEVGGRTKLAEVTLVGLGVLPVTDGQLDLGSSMTLDGLQQLMEGIGGSAEPHAVFVDLASGVDVRAFAGELHSLLIHDPDAFMLSGAPIIGTEELVNIDLSHVGWAPLVFAPLMGASAVVVLVLLVVSGANARRRDVAVGRALGFASSDVRRIHVWQSLSLIACALCIGVPAGVVAGSVAWRHYAGGLGVVPDTSIPWGELAAIGLGGVVVALAVSLWPATRTLGTRPVEVLHAE
ncbi:MAG TPA: FtsX-like permease family protein [Ilumatobacteraceae bacterium]|nr:FtsX-like permease family protein [Ilumatobacteraceae bacterium]